MITMKTAPRREQDVRSAMAKYVKARIRRDKHKPDDEKKKRRFDEDVVAPAWESLRAAVNALRE